MITSRENPISRLLQRVGRRLEPGLVLLEGRRVIDEARLASVPFEIIVTRQGEPLPVRGVQSVTLSPTLFNSLSQTETPQGVMAIVRSQPVSLDEARARARAAGWPLIVLDGVQDPGNVGTIVRTAAAAGAPAVVILPGTADPFGPKAVRAAAGNVFRLAVARANWPDLEALRGIGAAADGGRPAQDVSLEKAEMLVFGSEARGLSREGLEIVSIPMAAGIESLNVAAAAAVLLFQLRDRLCR